ncbi:hypothetical protein [Paenibacillus sp. P46E]|uniref:hypothetical protein n=1 Tax=Paenibacillus sp. P46E TaxID=1349436 RepID=UPI00093F1CCE|nr:hypothetical protein [Paenibacillus sp. P46E]
MKPIRKFGVAGSIVLSILLSACSNSNETANHAEATTGNQPASPEASAPAASAEASAIASAEASTEPSTEPSASASDSSENQAADDGVRPKYLPADFPLPKDVKVQTSSAAENGGKKSVLFIFTTTEDMAAVTKMYKEYFGTQNLTDASQTLDEKNLIIQGTNSGKQEEWSLIGGPLTSQKGVIELTLNWSEL